MFRAVSGILVALGCGAAFAAEQLPFTVVTAAQDGEGVIWGLSSGPPDQLGVFQNGQWSTRHSPSEGKKADPFCLTPMPNGAVACLWRVGKERLAVTWHLGEKWEPVAETSGTISYLVPATLADSQNRLWITTNAPEVRRAGPKGSPFFTYRIPQDAVHNPEAKYWASIHAVEDGRGRVWVWSRVFSSGTRSSRIRGALIFNGDTPERCDIGGIPADNALTLLAGKDDRHLWAGVLNDGLFEVDIDILQAQRVQPPNEEAFKQVESVVTQGGDLYVNARGAHGHDFWRRRNGRWERVLEGFDRFFNPERQCIPCENGVVVETRPSPWFVGRDTPPIRLDWQVGLDIDAPRSFVRCRDGRWLVLGHNSQYFYGKLQLPPPQEPQTGRVAPFGLRHGWIFDAKGNLWMVPDTKGKPVLRAFKAGKWQDYPLPEKCEPQDFEGIAADRAGRIWLFPNRNEVKAAYFDSRRGSWHESPKFETLLEELRADPPRFLEAWHFNFFAQYSADGKRIAFRSGRWELAYFDGKSWTRWRRPQIVPGEPQNRFVMGAPFFDATDKLCVTIEKNTWQFDDAAWKQTAFEAHFPADIPGGGSWRRPSPPELPGCVTPSPESLVWDNQGTAWLTWRCALYKWREGKCVKVFADTERNPFTIRRQVVDAWVEPNGCAYLKTTSSMTETFRIAPRTAPPKTKISLERLAKDSARVEFGTTSKAKVNFQWRLDGASWQGTEDRRIVLENLPAGPHVLQVRALDEELQSDPKPLETKFEIKVNPARQIAQFIFSLNAPDFEKRKAAIAGLARQPERAMPALQAAREKADDNQRWWIDAALQQIKRGQAASPAASPR